MSATMTATLPSTSLPPKFSWDWKESFLLLLSVMGITSIAYVLINDISLFTPNIERVSGEQIAQLIDTSGNVKYKSASIPAWENAQQSMPLYKKDQIFTDRGTKAEIVFNKGAKLEVDENSLVMIDLQAERASLNLIKGSFTSNSTNGKQGLDVEVGGKTTRIDTSNSKIQITSSGDQKGLELRVLEGNAKIQTANGQSTTLKANQVGTILPQAPKLAVRDVGIALKLPAQNSRFYVEPEKTTNIKFTWNILKAKANGKFELSADKNFETLIKDIAIEKNSEIVVPQLPKGTYYWRVKLFDTNNLDILESSEARSFTIQSSIIPTPLNTSTSELDIKTKTSDALLEWSGRSSMYLVQVSKNETFDSITWQTKTNDEKAISPNLAMGKYFWRVKNTEIGNESPWSQKSSFEVARPKNIAAPIVNTKNKNQNSSSTKKSNPSLPFVKLNQPNSANLTQQTPPTTEKTNSPSGSFKLKPANLNPVPESPALAQSNSLPVPPATVAEEVMSSNPPAKEAVIPIEKPAIIQTPPKLAEVSDAKSVRSESLTPQSFTLANANSISEPIPEEKAKTAPLDKNQKPIPEIPEIIVPLDQANISYRAELPAIAFRWNEVEHADSYQIQIASNAEFETAKIITDEKLSDPRLIKTMDAGKFYWRLKAQNQSGESSWTDTRTFTVAQAVKAPETSSPAKDELIAIKPRQSRKVLFKWEPLPDTDEYRLVISQDPNFSTVFKQTQTTKSEERIPIEKNGTYFWYLEGRNSKERLAVRTPTQSFSIAGDETGSPEENIAAAVDHGRVQLAYIPAMLQYSGSVGDQSGTHSGMAFVGFGLNAHYWIWTPFGLSFILSQTSTTAPANGSFSGGSVQIQEMEFSTLLRYLTQTGMGLIAKLGFAQYQTTVPNMIDNATGEHNLKVEAKNSIVLGFGLEKPLTPKFTILGGVDYGLSLASNTGASKIGLNAELIQRITESGWLLGYGYRYTSLTGSSLSQDENQTTGKFSISAHALKLSIGKGF